MPALAKKPAEASAAPAAKTVRVVALTHAFQNMRRYHRGDELEIQIVDGQSMPAWCIDVADAKRDRDGRIKIDELPIFFTANARGQG